MRSNWFSWQACFWLTYSSRKAWNNFWHLSANSSFTVSPAFSAVAVATSILKHLGSGIKTILKLPQNTELCSCSADRHKQHAEVHTTELCFARKMTPRDVWRAAFDQSVVVFKSCVVCSQSVVRIQTHWRPISSLSRLVSCYINNVSRKAFCAL